MLDEVLKYLDPKEGDSYLDLTAGYGGHSSAILARTKAPQNMVLVDRDTHAVDVNRRLYGDTVELRHEDFYSAAKTLAGSGRQFDCILIDLGVSSPQLDQAERGFSFMREGPLDMRMDQTQGQTAAELVNNSSEADLAGILARYGEEPMALAVAKHIVADRPFRTTTELAAIVCKVFGRTRLGKIHPATRTFQAIRIAVNEELTLLSDTLPLLPGLLNPGGRLAIISFHSLEDRLVKEYLREQSTVGYESTLRILTKHAVSGTHDVHNPRARSAKLRAAVKL